MHETIAILMFVGDELREHILDVLHLSKTRHGHPGFELCHSPAIVPLCVLQDCLAYLAKIKQHCKCLILDIKLQRPVEQRQVRYHRESLVVEIHGSICNLYDTVTECSEDSSPLYLVCRDGLLVLV